jgi:signal transduction histidine kinase
MNMKEYEKALELENQILPICEELFDNNLKTKTLMMMGDIYAQKNEFDPAEKYYLQGLELAQKANYEAYQTELLQNMGLLNLNKGDKVNAMEYLHAALEHAQRRNARKDLVKIHKILHTEYNKDGNIFKAYEHLEKMSSVEKELSGLESEKKLRSLSIQHEIQAAEKEKKMALQEEELFRLKNIELAKLNEELKSLSDEKSEILNITAHDLKNPLSGISSLSKKMHENAGKMSGEEISRYSKQIEDVSHRMFELVTKILDINAIESGKRNMNPELFDPSMIMGVAMFDNRPHALAKNIEIVYKQESLPKVVLDKTSVRQILDNLISNAVKFSPSGKKIILSTQLLDGKVIYEIKDEGPGLTKEDKKKLFGKFARLSAQPTGDENSTGLGLSITKRLTEAMNGKIWCESEEGEGAKFVVELPVNTN